MASNNQPETSKGGGEKEMEIIESWEDWHNQIFAIVKHAQEDQQRYRTKEYEAMWMIDYELHSFGGSVGYGIADFSSLEEAQIFLIKGIFTQETNPEIWLEMVEA